MKEIAAQGPHSLPHKLSLSKRRQRTGNARQRCYPGSRHKAGLNRTSQVHKLLMDSSSEGHGTSEGKSLWISILDLNLLEMRNWCLVSVGARC